MFKLIKATQDDIPDLAHILVQGWQDSYKNIVDQDWLNELDEQNYSKKWQTWLAEDGWNALIAKNDNGSAAGFISFGNLKTPPPGMSPIRPLYASEIYAVYVLSEFWRQGLGKALMKKAADELLKENSKSLCLWTAEKNKQAASFYKNLGGERCGKKQVNIGPSEIKEVCFGWRDTSPLL